MSFSRGMPLLARSANGPTAMVIHVLPLFCILLSDLSTIFRLSSPLLTSMFSCLRRTRFAEAAFKQALEADPLHSDSWNGLGTVSRDPLVQQHCWVRAVQLAHNPSAWANLGMLYVRWGLDIQVCRIMVLYRGVWAIRRCCVCVLMTLTSHLLLSLL